MDVSSVFHVWEHDLVLLGSVTMNVNSWEALTYLEEDLVDRADFTVMEALGAVSREGNVSGLIFDVLSKEEGRELIGDMAKRIVDVLVVGVDEVVDCLDEAGI